MHFALMASLSVHTAAGAWLYSLPLPSTAPKNEPIFISCVIKEEPVLAAKKETERPLPPKIPAAVPKPAIEPLRVPASQLNKKFDHDRYSAKDPRSQEKPIMRTLAASSSPKTADEFMTDPKQGKVFVSYFGLVKEKIHRTLRKKYGHKEGGRGNVSVWFVLNADGSLRDARVIEKETEAQKNLRSFAVDCLRASAPFGKFPSELNAPEIAFTLTVFFDEI